MRRDKGVCRFRFLSEGSFVLLWSVNCQLMVSRVYYVCKLLTREPREPNKTMLMSQQLIRETQVDQTSRN